MKIKLFVEDLNKAIEKAEKVLNKKSSLAVLKNLKLSVIYDKITLTVNNLESEIHIKLDGEIIETGAILINYDNFKLIKKLKGQIEIYNLDNIVTIKANREFKFTQTDITFFPDNNDKEFSNNAFNITANEFKAMLKIKVAAGNDEKRPMLKSICINNDLCWSCDGFRLMQYKLNIDNKYNKDIIIPINAINELDKIIDKKNDKILEFNYYSIKEFNSEELIYLQIKGKDFTYITRVLAGEYINIRTIIPTEFNQSITVNSDLLKESLEFANELEKNNKVPTVYKIKNNKFNVSRVTSTKSMNEQIECVIDSSTDIAIGFNIDYMMDSIKTLNANELNIKFINSISPIIITSSNNNELHMVLPVKLKNKVEEDAV